MLATDPTTQAHEAARHAATIKLRAERKAGELLKRLERDQGRAGQERCPTSDNVPSPYAAALDFIAACDALGPLAEALAYAERRHRAALAVAGIHDQRPAAREHAAEVALHALAPLTPYVRHVTTASAEHHRERLLSTHDPEETR